MTAGRWLAVALAAAHLVFVVLGAANLFPTDPSSPSRAARWYGAVSGAGMHYGFFAPSVSHQVRVRFSLSDGAGRTWEDDFEVGHSQEVKLRIGGMVMTFSHEEGDEALRQDLLASWAAAMFARHPDASELTITIEVYEVPPMADYRAGVRPAWVAVHSAKFSRDAGDPVPEGKTRP